MPESMRAPFAARWTRSGYRSDWTSRRSAKVASPPRKSTSSPRRNTFIVICPILVVAFLAGTPVAGILGLGGLLYFLTTGDAPPVMIPSAFQYGISSFVLLAVPFFMVAGILMEFTGMAKRMVDMVQAWVGHWRGGLLIAEVLATYLFSGVSGWSCTPRNA